MVCVAMSPYEKGGQGQPSIHPSHDLLPRHPRMTRKDIRNAASLPMLRPEKYDKKAPCFSPAQTAHDVRPPLWAPAPPAGAEPPRCSASYAMIVPSTRSTLPPPSVLPLNTASSLLQPLPVTGARQQGKIRVGRRRQGRPQGQRRIRCWPRAGGGPLGPLSRALQSPSGRHPGLPRGYAQQQHSGAQIGWSMGQKLHPGNRNCPQTRIKEKKKKRQKGKEPRGHGQQDRRIAASGIEMCIVVSHSQLGI